MLTSRHRAEGGDGIAVSGGSGDGWVDICVLSYMWTWSSLTIQKRG
jgi:hypothetical protein